MTQTTTFRKGPDICGPAKRQIGWVIGTALYVCILEALGGVAVWGGVRYRARGSALLGVALVAMGLSTVVISRNQVRAEAARLRARKAWLARAIVRHATILSRSEEHNPYGETQEEAWEHRLTLALEEPPGMSVELQVSERVYGQLTKQDSVTLYCDPADPLTFLVEGE